MAVEHLGRPPPPSGFLLFLPAVKPPACLGISQHEACGLQRPVTHSFVASWGLSPRPGLEGQGLNSVRPGHSSRDFCDDSQHGPGLGYAHPCGPAPDPGSPLLAKEETLAGGLVALFASPWPEAWRRTRGSQPPRRRDSLTHTAVGRAPLSPSAAPQEANVHAYCLPLGFRIMEAKIQHTSWQLHPGGPHPTVTCEAVPSQQGRELPHEL